MNQQSSEEGGSQNHMIKKVFQRHFGKKICYVHRNNTPTYKYICKANKHNGTGQLSRNKLQGNFNLLNLVSVHVAGSSPGGHSPRSRAHADMNTCKFRSLSCGQEIHMGAIIYRGTDLYFHFVHLFCYLAFSICYDHYQ